MMMSNYVLFIYNIHWFPILRVAVLWLSAEGTFLAGTEIEWIFELSMCFFPRKSMESHLQGSKSCAVLQDFPSSIAAFILTMDNIFLLYWSGKRVVALLGPFPNGGGHFYHFFPWCWRKGPTKVKMPVKTGCPPFFLSVLLSLTRRLVSFLTVLA